MVKTVRLGELTPDPRNARKHNQRNIDAIASSITDVGTGRSIVIDEDGVILAGNGVVQAAGQAGISKVRIIDVTGDELIAVRRSGLSPEQKIALAVADNRAGELSEWDLEALAALVQDADLSALWTDDEIEELLARAMPPAVSFPEYDESAEKDVEWLECPECGHRWAK